MIRSEYSSTTWDQRTVEVVLCDEEDDVTFRPDWEMDEEYKPHGI